MIFAADLHIRRTPPRARIDDYFQAQERKFRFILEQAQASPPLLVAGDFFHQSRPGPYLEQWAINLLREYDVRPIVVPGQHDLPGHSLEQILDSGLGVLAAAGLIELLTDPRLFYQGKWNDLWLSITGVPYGLSPIDSITPTINNILLWHRMVINEPLWPGQEADKAPALLRKYPQFDIIVTGDNHTTFAIAETQKLEPGKNYDIDKCQRWIINPGSMMRMTAAQTEHRPCIFKWESEKLEQIFLPIEQDVFDLSELEQAKEKDSRVQAFVDRLDPKSGLGLLYAQVEFDKLYQANIERFLQDFYPDVDQETKDLIWRCLE